MGRRQAPRPQVRTSPPGRPGERHSPAAAGVPFPRLPARSRTGEGSPPGGGGRFSRARAAAGPLPAGGTYHLGQLDPAEGAPQVVQVAAEAAQPAALADGLRRGLVGTAGPRDHGGAGRLAVEALQVIAVPHGAGAAALLRGCPRSSEPSRVALT